VLPDSEVWYKVQPEISKLTRVCSYDRAGLGFSELRPGARFLKNWRIGEGFPYKITQSIEVVSRPEGPLSQVRCQPGSLSQARKQRRPR
jgi:hypothetical protein